MTTEHQPQGPYSVNRDGWPDGPWATEPDRVDFVHAGLACLLVRNHHGAWCGYAGVPASHPLYGQPFSEIDADLDVHGGLTYSDRCRGHICHVPEPGMPDDVWWLGFDCGHAFDLMPGFAALCATLDARLPPRPPLPPGFEDVYRDLAYARHETERLAEQLAALTAT